MAITNLSPMPKFFALTNAGLPLSGGKLYTYAVGSSTPKVTYKDSTGATENANPVVLDSSGRADVWIGTGQYKFILKDSSDNIIWTVDSIGQNAVLTNTVTTVTNLRALSAASSTMVTVLGYSAAGDGGGGTFIWDTSLSSADDGGIIIKPTGYSGAGRWRRLLNGYVTPRMYGATGDGSTDDSAAVISADTYASANGMFLLLPGGTDGSAPSSGIYVINSVPSFSSKVQFEAGSQLSWIAGMHPSMHVSIPDYLQHFICSAVNYPALSGVNEIFPEWFGAKGDGSFANNTPGTDDTNAIQCAINSCTAGMVVTLNSGKKYWSGSLSWSSGITLKGSQSYENDASSTPANEYSANLQFNGASGVFLSYSGTSPQTIKDLVIDGNSKCGHIVSLSGSNVQVLRCTLRNNVATASSSGVFLTGTSNLKATIQGCNIYNVYFGIYSDTPYTLYTDSCILDCSIARCVGGIYVTKGEKWIIRGNKIYSASNVCMKVEGADFLISGNILNEVLGYGIYILNNAVGASHITDNCIWSLVTNNTTGIAIETTSAGGQVLVDNNVLKSVTSLTGNQGIRTTNSGATLLGYIHDNIILGYATPYSIGDGLATSLRYQDDTALKTYRAILGNVAKATTTDATGLFAIIKDTLLGTSLNNSQLLESVGGPVGSATNSIILDRKFLLRNSAGDDTTGVRIHDCLSQNETFVTPRTDTKAWYERSFDGSHHWGSGSTEYAGVDSSLFTFNVPISASNFTSAWQDLTIGLTGSSQVVVATDTGTISSFTPTICRCKIFGNSAELCICFTLSTGGNFNSINLTINSNPANMKGPSAPVNTILGAGAGTMSTGHTPYYRYLPALVYSDGSKKIILSSGALNSSEDYYQFVSTHVFSLSVSYEMAATY